ncbi:hypothetical protein [Aureispira anguillae]|uniref:Uncharacterized protein n=1 Tax=Aureispira anguillae TaxID=2864201 RepID=A0A915YJ52_9BACT|nr:hypothetical protein [Aureispira anguillae]BDS14063.1 hypothetical protein AsAng_0048280 [Aureispira anguillae]
MKLNNLNNAQIINILWLIFVTSLTLGIVIPTDSIFNHFLSAHAISIMLLFLGVGFMGLVFRNNLVIFSNFLACIVLCSFIKESLTQEFTYSTPTDDIQIRVAHLVLDNEDEIANFDQSFKGLEANFLSIQTPIEPSLEETLTKRLSAQMPYWKKIICNNDLAMFVFSKYKLQNIDTLYYSGNNTVSLVGTMFIDSVHEEISFLNTRVPIDKGMRRQTEQHLAKLSNYINTNFQDKPLLTFSGTQLTSWTPELQEFKNVHRLNDSEIDLQLATRDEHIFYSKDLVCTAFDKFFDGNGVIATYQFRAPSKATAQHTYANGLEGAAL